MTLEFCSSIRVVIITYCCSAGLVVVIVVRARGYNIIGLTQHRPNTALQVRLTFGDKAN